VVFEYLLDIVYGYMVSYVVVVVVVGSFCVVWVVGLVCARNLLFLVVLCYCVVKSDGLIG